MSAPVPQNEEQSSAGQRQLAALRATLEERLAELEDALADPSRGESLEGLILDLAKVATEEAHAASAQACLDTQAAADREIAEVQASALATLEAAQNAMEHERATSFELRRAVNEAQAHVEALERAKQTEARATLEQFKAEAERTRAIVAGLEQTTADGKAQLKIAQASIVELQKSAESAEARFKERVEALERERTEAQTARDGLVADLARERSAAAALQHTHAQMQSLVEEKLEAERAAVADLGRAVERAGEQVAAIALDLSQSRSAQQAAETALARERDGVVALNAELAEARLQIDAERASSADLRRAVERAGAQMAAIEPDLSKSHAAREAVENELTRQREFGKALERQLAETRSQLEAERMSNTDLRHAAERAGEQVAAIAPDLSESRAAREALENELTRQREFGKALERQLADTRSQLEAERTSNTDLRHAAERAGEQVAAIEPDLSESRAAREALEKELTRERESAVALKREFAETQSQLEAERQSGIDSHLAVEYADERLKTLLREKELIEASQGLLTTQLKNAGAEAAAAVASAADAERQLAATRAEAAALGADLEARRADLDALRSERDAIAGELERARRALTAAPDFDLVVVDDDEPLSADAHVGQAEEPEEWQSVRLATRYVFPRRIEIFIDGVAGELFDISVAGCQLMSPAVLKPGHEVHIVLPSEQTPVACRGKIAWARLEPPPKRGQPARYRAGVSFTHADKIAVEAFAMQRGARS